MSKWLPPAGGGYTGASSDGSVPAETHRPPKGPSGVSAPSKGKQTKASLRRMTREGTP